jgi:FkbM family methyltransferase
MPDDHSPESWIAKLIEALYRALLLRAPDPAGLEANVEYYTKYLADGGDLADLIIAFLSSTEFIQNFSCFQAEYSRSEFNKFTLDQSQHGETDLLVRLMINAAAKYRVVVDVGANGRARSNSYDLLRFCRWKGILIEANSALIAGIERDFAELDVKIINSAVSDYTGTGILHLGINNDVSSLTEQNARNWGDIKGSIPVTVRLLSEILRSHEVPLDFDLLSIDIEGEDIKVFNEIMITGFRPRWVIIEASFGFSTKSLADLPFCKVAKQLYRIAAQTEANLILSRSQEAVPIETPRNIERY